MPAKFVAKNIVAVLATKNNKNKNNFNISKIVAIFTDKSPPKIIL